MSVLEEEEEVLPGHKQQEVEKGLTVGGIKSKVKVTPSPGGCYLITADH